MSQISLNRVESAARQLFGALAIAFALLATGVFISDWTPATIDNDIEWLWWMGAGFGGFGLISLGIAAFPYVGPDDPRLARRKARWIQAGMLWLGSAPVLCFTASIIDYWT